MEEIFKDPIFARLKEEVPKFHHKVIALAGDCSLEGLGISVTDKESLIRDVSIVFHAAATVRFDEKLNLATAINVQGTADVLELCKEMQKLKAFIHVSTAYSNCFSGEIDEKFYNYSINYEELKSLINCIPNDTIESITPRIIKPWPNTYAFTKAVAEDLIRKRNKNLPIGIFRPGIVISTASDPIPGWIDNFYGPTGVVAGAMSGLLRTLHCDPKANANVVPVDLTVSALIASAWDVANQTTRRDEDMLVYNFVSSEAPLSWADFHKSNTQIVNQYPTSNALWYLCFKINSNKYMNSLYVVLLHFIPALLVDTISLCIGKKPRLLRMYQKIQKFANVLSYFTVREWKFSNKNVQDLWNRLDPKDKQIYFFSMKNFNWSSYFDTYIKGVRVYLLKDDLKTLEDSRIKWNRLYWMHQVMKVLISTFGFWFLYNTLTRILHW